jgi:hypothetical protein
MVGNMGFQIFATPLYSGDYEKKRVKTKGNEVMLLVL